LDQPYPLADQQQPIEQLGIGRSLLYELLAEGRVESIHMVVRARKLRQP
jgi:hypothetical protein